MRVVGDVGGELGETGKRGTEKDFLGRTRLKSLLTTLLAVRISPPVDDERLHNNETTGTLRSVHRSVL